MENSYKYVVAGHPFEVTLPEGFSKEDHLSSYEPFICTDESVQPLFRLRVEFADDLHEANPGQVKDVMNDEAPYFWLFEEIEGRYNFGFSYTKSRPDCILKPSEDYSDNVVYIPRQYASRLLEFALSNSMMLLYTFNTSPYDTLMIHASVIAYEGKGYVFLGRSGTGKSTHSRLWLENIEGTWLLNDDNPVIRVIDGAVNVYGTPWSGKTPCYKNEHYELAGCVRLSQAPYNHIRKLPVLQAYGAIHPSCPPEFAYDPALYDHISGFIGQLLSKVPFYHLACLPDEEAARLSCTTLTEKGV